MKVPSISIARFPRSGILFFVVMVCFSCNSINHDEHDISFQEFNQMADKITILSLKYKKPVDKIIDSLYDTIPHHPAVDLCIKYLLKGGFNPADQRYADSALMVIYRQGLTKRLPLTYGMALLYKGTALLYQQKDNNAYTYLHKGIKMVQGTSDTGVFLPDFASIFYHQGNYLLAAHYYKECAENSKNEVSDKTRNNFMNWYFVSSNYDNVGLCYDKAGMTDTALFYFKKGFDCINQQENNPRYPEGASRYYERVRGLLYGNMGTALLHKGDTNDAEIFFNKSIRINNGPDNEFKDAYTTQLKLADLYLHTSRPEEARKLLDTFAIETNSVHGDPYGSVAIEWYQLESDYYKFIHNIPRAYDYIMIYNAHKDSADKKVKQQLVGIDFNDLFSNIKQENSLEAMQVENKMNNLNVMVAIIFFALLIGAGVFTSRKNRQLEKLNKKITFKNTEMRQTLGALEQSQHENMRMMEMVAHDLRDPVGAMMSMTNLLLEEEQDRETQKEFLTLMHTSESNLLEMITGILSSNITLDGIKKQDVDMKALLEYCVDLLKFKAADKKQEIKLDAEEVTLKTDREKIWRVMSNLITNAIKFSSEKASVEVGMHKKEGTIRISVKDSGIGIPAELQDKLFDMYVDKRRAGTRGERSFGLGLSISKQIVEALGGKIWFESAEGSGTTFYLEFPEQQNA